MSNDRNNDNMTATVEIKQIDSTPSGSQTIKGGSKGTEDV